MSAKTRVVLLQAFLSHSADAKLESDKLRQPHIAADLTVSKRPGTSNRIEIHFAVFNNLYLCFSFMKLAETL